MLTQIPFFYEKENKIVPMFCIFADLFNISLNGILMLVFSYLASAFSVNCQVASQKLHL